MLLCIFVMLKMLNIYRFLHHGNLLYTKPAICTHDFFEGVCRLTSTDKGEEVRLFWYGSSVEDPVHLAWLGWLRMQDPAAALALARLLHVKGIYGKLGVNRQAQAVQRAQEIGLL